MKSETSITENNEDVISIGNWIGTLIVSGIPFVGFVALIILATSSPYKSKQNFACATLILMLIGFILVVLLNLSGA